MADIETLIDRACTPTKWRRWPLYAFAVALLALAAGPIVVAVGVLGDSVAEARTVATSPPLDDLRGRANDAGHGLRAIEEYHDRRIAPIERVLLRYRDEPELARRVAVSLVKQANAVDVEPRLLLAVLLVENPWLDPEIRSPVGAVGLMQVMPQHRGNWGPCRPDLTDVESNICHGARIFAHYFRAEDGDIERALLRYNGCVRGTNTPDCHRYPYHVYARAGRASILAWLQPSAPRAASP